MHVNRRLSVAFCIALVSALASSTDALASPVTVKLRVEGSTKTLFEGEVTTQGATFETQSSNGPHPCNYKENGSSSEGGTSEDENGGNASGTPTTALRDAALQNNLPFNAEWFGSGKEGNGDPGDFFVTQVGSDINETSSPYDSWGYAVNDTTAPVGGCQIALAPGNEVLWAYNYFNLSHLLSLAGPATVNAGTPFTVHVTDGHTGEPIEHAAIGEVVNGVTTTISGSATTDADGNATVKLASAGTVTLKATQAESVRSNGLVVCVHNGNDGTCGTSAPGQSPTVTSNKAGTTSTLPETDVAKVLGIKNGHVYASQRSPRLLTGSVVVPAGATLREVRISLRRKQHGRCFSFNGSRERFMKAKCKSTSFFSVGSAESFSYLLPARLPAGHYTYEIQAVDSSGVATKLSPGVSRVVFSVK